MKMSNQITNEMITKLIDTYQSNKEELHELREFLFEHGILDDGVSDINATFEMGYNNALEYVFSVLGIQDYE